MSRLNPVTPRLVAAAAQSGFSLIELMVAITISLLMMTAVLTLFLNISRTNDEMAKTNSLIENGRFAVQLLQNDLAHGGFWNGYIPQFDDLTATAAPTDVPTAVPAPCAAPATWNVVYKTNLLGIPVQAYESVPSGCSGLLTDKKANTDVLLVRHAETCAPGVGTCPADTSGALYFQASFCASETAAPYVLDTSGFDRHKRNCTTLADKRRYISNLYYIRDHATTAGDGIPTLMRSSFDLDGGVLAHQPAQALIEGIEGFRVELGIDNLSDSGAAVNYTSAVTWADTANKNSPTNRGDGTPDGDFIRCTDATPCAFGDLSNTVTVQLHVLVRSLQPTSGYSSNKSYRLGSTTLGPFTDNFKRHVFSTTVRMNNISGRRETP